MIVFGVLANGYDLLPFAIRLHASGDVYDTTVEMVKVERDGHID